MDALGYGPTRLYLLGDFREIVNFSATNAQARRIVRNHQLAAGSIGQR